MTEEWNWLLSAILSQHPRYFFTIQPRLRNNLDDAFSKLMRKFISSSIETRKIESFFLRTVTVTHEENQNEFEEPVRCRRFFADSILFFPSTRHCVIKLIRRKYGMPETQAALSRYSETLKRHKERKSPLCTTIQKCCKQIEKLESKRRKKTQLRMVKVRKLLFVKRGKRKQNQCYHFFQTFFL